MKITQCKIENKNLINNTINYCDLYDNNKFINFLKNIIILNNKYINFFFINYQIFIKGIDIANILNYKDPIDAINNYVKNEDKNSNNNILEKSIFINEFGFYSLLINSNYEDISKIKNIMLYEIFPFIRKNDLNYKISIYKDENLNYYDKKDVVYIIKIRYNIYKYGRSSNIIKRLQNHKKLLEYENIIKIYKMDNINQIINLEKKIKNLVYSLKINKNLNFNNDSNQVELFEIDNCNLEKLLDKINIFYSDILEK